jgi:hypothetical protein
MPYMASSGRDSLADAQASGFARDDALRAQNMYANIVAPAGPRRRPTAAREFRHLPFGSPDKHPPSFADTALRFLCAAEACLMVQRSGSSRGALQMGRRPLDPRKPVVVQVREDRGDGAAAPFLARRFRPPRAGIEVRKHKLVHRVVDRVSSYSGHRENPGRQPTFSAASTPASESPRGSPMQSRE